MSGRAPSSLDHVTPHHLEITSKHVSGIKMFSITVVVGQLRPAANECNRSPLVPTNRPYFGAGLMCFQLSRCKTIRDKQECKFGTISEWFLLHHITVPFLFIFHNM